MIVTKNERGFEIIESATYLPGCAGFSRLVKQSPARPSQSYLWIGEYHHLNREQVAELVQHLQAWLETGSLEVKEQP